MKMPDPQQIKPASPAERGVILLLAINALFLICYIAIQYKFRMHSDSAAANLLAQEIRLTGHFFPRDWNYVFGDLWVVAPHTLIVPLLWVFPNGYGLHAAAGIVVAACVLSGTWLVGSIAGMSRLAKLTTVALLAAGLSSNLAEHLYGQFAYGIIYFLECYILYCAWSFARARGRIRALWACALGLLIAVVAWANPQRAVVYYLLPLLGAALVLWLLPQQRRETGVERVPSRGALGAVVLIVILAFWLGSRLYLPSLNLAHGLQNPMPAKWLGFDDILRNATGAVRGLLSLLGGLPPAGESVGTLAGVVVALRILAGATLLMLAPWALLQALRSSHPGRQFFAIATLFWIGVSAFVFVTTSLPDMHDPETSSRYMVPGMVGMLIVLVGTLIDNQSIGPLKRAAGICAVAVLTFSAPVNYSLIEVPEQLAQGKLDQANARMRLVHFLKSQDLHYGYASFWNAGVLTVLSGNDTAVRQIVINGGLPLPMRHLSSDRWYAASAWRGPSFLLLDSYEAGIVDWTAMAKRVGEPVRRLEFEGMWVIVYDHNIARDFPDWDMHVATPVNMPVNAQTMHSAGHLDEGNTTVTAERGEAGMLHYGPYRNLAAGHYRVNYAIRTEGVDVHDFGFVDAVADSGKQVLASRVINRAGPQLAFIEFTLKQFTNQIEFRVFSNGAGQFSMTNIELVNADLK